MSTREHGSDDGSFARDAGTQTGKAIALIAVMVIIGVLLLRHVGSTTTGTGAIAAATPTTTSPTTVPATTTTTVALLPPSAIKLQVLNGGIASEPVSGLFSKKLQASPGYNTLAPSNALVRVTTSMIYVLAPQYMPEGLALATTVGLPATAVTTVIPTPNPIPASVRTVANLVLDVGPDLAAKA